MANNTFEHIGSYAPNAQGGRSGARETLADHHLMTENPYESPKCMGETAIAPTTLQVQATRSFRAMAFVLLLPAIFNYWEFDAHVVSRLPGLLAGNCRSANVLGFVVGVALVWFFAMPALETLARFVRIIFAGGTDRAAWQEILYRSLNRALYLAVGGAVLWGIWVFGFYEMKSDFQTISWAVGVPAHVLAACWYVPLIGRWYRLAVSSAPPGSPQNNAVQPSGDQAACRW